MHRFKKYAIGAGGMLVLVAAIVLATGSGSAVAAQITSVFVTNDASHAVPVRDQNLDANGNVKVHEQGTSTVAGTVSARPSAATRPWHFVAASGSESWARFVTPLTDSTIELSSISVSPLTGGGPVRVVEVQYFTVPNTNTECSAELGVAGESDLPWHLEAIAQPFAQAFPTPLEEVPPAGKKGCLRVASTDPAYINIAGFYGS
jgi:hypothetical protein